MQEKTKLQIQMIKLRLFVSAIILFASCNNENINYKKLEKEFKHLNHSNITVDSSQFCVKIKLDDFDSIRVEGVISDSSLLNYSFNCGGFIESVSRIKKIYFFKNRMKIFDSEDSPIIGAILLNDSFEITAIANKCSGNSPNTYFLDYYIGAKHIQERITFEDKSIDGFEKSVKKIELPPNSNNKLCGFSNIFKAYNSCPELLNMNTLCIDYGVGTDSILGDSSDFFPHIKR